MELNRTSVWIRWAVAGLLVLFSQALLSAVTIREGKWYCVEASYNDTTLTGFETTFTVKAGAKYEASFSYNGDEGAGKSNYQISASGDTLFSRFNQLFSARGSGWNTTGSDTIYWYSLDCSEDIWIKAGQTAIGYGYSASTKKNRIAFSVQGDSILTLKSPDGKTVLKYTYGVPRIPHNPVLFRVQMAVQKQLGNFNPGAGDKVVIRGDFNGWIGDTALMTEGGTQGVYELTLDFNYVYIDTELTYKFFILKSGGSEQPESDPIREFVLKAHGQEIGVVYFDRRARTDIVTSFPITEKPASDHAPATAYNSRRDEYIVVWTSEALNIYGRIFKADGTPNGQPFPVAALASEEDYAQVDYNARENEYMAVWEDKRSGKWDVYGVRLAADGKKLVSPNSGADTSFAVCTQDSSQFEPRIAYNYIDNCYLVVWLDYRNSRAEQMMRVNFDVYGQRLAANGSFLLPGSTQDPKVNFPIVFNKYYDEAYPDVAYCGNVGKKLNEWLVVFVRREAIAYSYYYGSRIWGVRVKGNSGALLNTWGIEAEQDALGKATGSYEGPPWLPEFPIGWDNKDFWAMIPFVQGSPHVESNDDPAPVSLGKANAERYPIPEFFVAWSDFRNGGDVFGQRVAYFPDSTAFRLKFKNVAGPDSLFTAVLLDKDGKWPENPMAWITWPNFTVTDEPSYQSWNNISYGSTDGAFLVVWNDWRASFLENWVNPMPSSDIYGQRLWLNAADSCLVWIDHDANRDVGSTLNTPIAFTEADEGCQSYPAVAFGEKNNSFLVGYVYSEIPGFFNIQGNIYKGAPMVPSGVDSRDTKGRPAEFMLGLNYPNPFNPDTRIQYFLAEEGRVQLKVFDMLGREVATLVDEKRPAGGHTAVWNGRQSDGTQASSGVYLYRLHWSKDGRNVQQNGKMVLIR